MFHISIYDTLPLSQSLSNRKWLYHYAIKFRLLCALLEVNLMRKFWGYQQYTTHRKRLLFNPYSSPVQVTETMITSYNRLSMQNILHRRKGSIDPKLTVFTKPMNMSTQRSPQQNNVASLWSTHSCVN